ncbi:MAG: ADP-ribosylglycohydrolase family protein [Egibacteraceae bacterium]
MSRDAADLSERFRGCLLGVAAGDALGAPFEGLSQVDADAVARWVASPAPLRWTDDTHMTLGVARSLLDCKGVDGPRLAAELARTHDAEPWRGYGAGPPQVFAALAQGAAWDAPAAQLFGGGGSFGNGAAMRVAPVGLVAHRAPDTLAAWARTSARVTHAHELGQQAAVLQAAAVGWLVTAEPAGRDPAGVLDHLGTLAPDGVFRERLDRVAGLTSSASMRTVVAELGNGITGLEAVPAALHAFLRQPRSLPDAVTYAVRLGGDTDTIASMTGALAGAFLGEAAVPPAWRDRLEAADELVRLADALARLARSWSAAPRGDRGAREG